MNGRNYLSGLALSGALLVLPTTSQAALIFDLQEVGANVVLTASGSIDLTGLGTPQSSTAVAGAFFASAGSGPPVIVGA